MSFVVNPYILSGGGLITVTSYSGDSGTQQVTTGQDLQGGGLAWIKDTSTTENHFLFDTEIEPSDKYLQPNLTSAEQSGDLMDFTANGLSVKSTAVNNTGRDYVCLSWLVEAGYLDIVTYTGNATNRTISHNLGEEPKMMIVKNRTDVDPWAVYHANNTAEPATEYLSLNTSEATADDDTYWNDTAPTSSVFSVGTGKTNGGSKTMVAYLFAEKSGASNFGAYSGTTTINTGLGSLSAFLVKRTDAAGTWYLFYNDGGTWYHIEPNSTAARATGLVSVAGGDITLSGDAALGNGVYAAWK